MTDADSAPDVEKTLLPVFTFVTDGASYAEMLQSFEAAGFTAERAIFTQFRGGDKPGRPEPYSTITELVATAEAPFYVLCHQDVRADQGHGFEELIKAIEELDALDPAWAIAGNAGGSEKLRMVRRISDPHGGSTGQPLPTRVQTLDENFLVIRTATGVRCSAPLSGFHHYATDFCLNALCRGRSAYVIDFCVRHLSGGRKTAEYFACRDRFLDHWHPVFFARYIRTPMEVLFFSKWKLLVACLGSTPVRRVIKNSPLLGAVVGALFARRLRPLPQ
jgi:hypothetical protein